MQPILVVRETAPWSRWSVHAFFRALCCLCVRASGCVRVCELPSGAGTHSGSSSLGSPAPLPHPRLLRDAKRASGRAGRVRVCVCLLVFCRRRRLTPDFPPRLCLSRLLPAPSVMPTCGSSASPPSPPPPTVRALSLVRTHLLLPAAELQPPRACLLLQPMNRRQPHWLLKRKGGE